jgi:hypothetical protein
MRSYLNEDIHAKTGRGKPSAGAVKPAMKLIDRFAWEPAAHSSPSPAIKEESRDNLLAPAPQGTG